MLCNLLVSGLLVFCAVAKLRNSGKSAKSCKIHKNTQNTCEIRQKSYQIRLYSNFKTCLSYWGYLLAVNPQIYVKTSSLKCANNTPKLPGVDYVAKNWALAMMLKALPLVHFLCQKNIKNAGLISAKPIDSQRNLPKYNHKIHCFLLIAFRLSLPQKFPQNQLIFPRFCP